MILLFFNDYSNFHKQQNLTKKNFFFQILAILFALLALVKAQRFGGAFDFFPAYEFGGGLDAPIQAARDPRANTGPVVFPPAPPDNGETSGVVVGASGYGFVPPSGQGTYHRPLSNQKPPETTPYWRTTARSPPIGRVGSEGCDPVTVTWKVEGGAHIKVVVRTPVAILVGRSERAMVTATPYSDAASLLIQFTVSYPVNNLSISFNVNTNPAT